MSFGIRQSTNPQPKPEDHRPKSAQYRQFPPETVGTRFVLEWSGMGTDQTVLSSNCLSLLVTFPGSLDKRTFPLPFRVFISKIRGNHRVKRRSDTAALDKLARSDVVRLQRGHCQPAVKV